MPSETEHSENTPPRGLILKHLFRKLFFEDWLLKLLALGVTLALWLIVTGLSTPTTIRFSGIPLALRYSSDTEITNSPIQEVEIVISGDRRKINQINKNDLIVSVDITDVPQGERVIQLTPSNVLIDLPTGVRIDEIQPNRIAVKLEAVAEKDVDVKVETEGDLAEGSEVYSKSAAPSTVKVRGPASFIKALTTVSTEKIDIQGRDADFTAKQVTFNITNPKGAVLDRFVDVTFRIGEKRVERSISLPLDDGSGRKATFVLFGPKTVVNGIRPEDLKIEVTKSGTGEAKPSLTLPPELQGKVEIRKPKP